RRVLGVGRGRERPASGQLAQLDAALAGRVALQQLSQRRLDLLALDRAGLGQPSLVDGVRRQEQERLDGACQLAHAASAAATSGCRCFSGTVMTISLNGSSWIQVASPRLYIS